MNCPGPEKWAMLSMDLLTPQEAETLRQHLEACEVCRATYRASRREHASLVRAFEVFDQGHDRQREELMAALRAVDPCDNASRGAPAGGWFGDLLMSIKQQKGRWAAAALLPAAVVVFAIVSLIASSPTVALQVALGRIRDARTMVCNVSMDYHIETEALPEGATSDADTPTDIPTRGTLSMYSDGQTRAWLRQTDDPPMTELIRSDRMYVTKADKVTLVKLTEDQTGAGYLESPEVLLRRLLDLSEEPDQDLGIMRIDNHEAVGFEIPASKLGFGGAGDEAEASVVRIWVDVESQLPVRVEYDVVQKGGPVRITMKGAWDHIRWDVPLDPQAFVPPEVTPDDEVQNLSMPPANETALIDGLRAYADLSSEVTKIIASLEARAKERPEIRPNVEKMRKWLDADSAYPKSLDPQALAMALAARQGALQGRALNDYRRVHGQDSSMPEEQKAQLNDRQQKVAGAIGAAGLYYRKLVMEGREPEYFGASVEPGDATAVLVRWRLDDGHMRVIYGDLHAETLPTHE